MSKELKNRFDFVLLFDVQDGNPNGDPDAGNLPRIDPETGMGLVTDVCLKRKIRNYVQLTKDHDAPAQDVPLEGHRFEIYVKERAILNNQHERGYAALKLKSDEKKSNRDDVNKVQAWMCQNFFDVRTFGAVMSTGKNAGQVRGPVQLTFARSVDPIMALEHSITRMAVTTEKEAEDQSGDNRTMGRKYTVPYGLYVAHGFVSAHLANQTGFDTDDLALLWESLGSMFEHDRSAARGQMATRGLYVFEHADKLGSAPSHKLFECIHVQRKPDVAAPRSFADYAVQIDETALPQGVQLHRILG
jgi:CRISPR-associated protein Csd2